MDMSSNHLLQVQAYREERIPEHLLFLRVRGSTGDGFAVAVLLVRAIKYFSGRAVFVWAPKGPNTSSGRLV